MKDLIRYYEINKKYYRFCDFYNSKFLNIIKCNIKEFLENKNIIFDFIVYEYDNSITIRNSNKNIIKIDKTKITISLPDNVILKQHIDENIKYFEKIQRIYRSYLTIRKIFRKKAYNYLLNIINNFENIEFYKEVFFSKKILTIFFIKLINNKTFITINGIYSENLRISNLIDELLVEKYLVSNNSLLKINRINKLKMINE